MPPLILDLCGGTGSWSKPYKDAGYEVLIVDPADYEGIDCRMTVREFLDNGAHLWQGATVHGILAAPPCDHFAVSGARWFAEKDKDGRTAAAVQVVRDCLEAVAKFTPRWWALENPIGRIERLVPELGRPSLRFDPCDYGDPYTKRTVLWGKFRPPMHRPCVNTEGSKMHRIWGGGEGKRLRSMTPPGFAKAFMEANP